MPALRERALGPALALEARPRIWAFPEVRSHGLVILTDDALFLASPAEAPDAAWLKDLEAASDVESMIGTSAERIDLEAIRRSRHDLLADSLVLDLGAEPVII